MKSGKKWMGIALVGIMFASSLAFAAVQSFTSAPAHNTDALPVSLLPTENIIDYRLSQDQLNEAVARGITVATYTYDRSCIKCADEKALLEQMVMSQEFRGQIILEEIVQDGPSSLEATSHLGKSRLDNIDTDSASRLFCDLVINPPLGCAMLQQQVA